MCIPIGQELKLTEEYYKKSEDVWYSKEEYDNMKTIREEYQSAYEELLLWLKEKHKEIYEEFTYHSSENNDYFQVIKMPTVIKIGFILIFIAIIWLGLYGLKYSPRRE